MFRPAKPKVENKAVVEQVKAAAAPLMPSPIIPYRPRGGIRITEPVTATAKNIIIGGGFDYNPWAEPPDYYASITDPWYGGDKDACSWAMFAGTFKKLKLRVRINQLVADTTISLRVNGVDTGMSITVPAGVTGIFDNTTEVSVAVNDLVCMHLVSEYNECDYMAPMWILEFQLS